MIKGKEQCLIPEYILKFLEKLYLGIVPEDYGQRMVSKKLLSKMKSLYHFYNDKIPSNFGRLLCPEYLIDFIKKIDLIEYTDEDTAYIKEVPEGSLKYAFINACGGMSYKSENLLVLNDVAEITTNGITYSVQNGIIRVNGTATAQTNIKFINLNHNVLNQPFTFATLNDTSYSDVAIVAINFANDSGYTFTLSQNAYRRFTLTDKVLETFDLKINNGASISNMVLKPMVVESSTVPTEYQPYFEGVRDSAVTSVVSKDSNNTTIDTLTIPSQVQALTGYGWGINDTCFNYIDFENKKFVQKVGRVDLGTLNWDISGSSYFRSSIINGIILGSNNIAGNIVVSKYKTYSYYNLSSNTGIALGDNHRVYINDTSYSTAEAFKTAMSGVYLYYELETPVETDITSLMPSNFGYIEVRPEGKVIFNNEYEQAVPSAITYLVEV